MAAERIGVQTSIGGLYFDAVFMREHTSEVTKTEHPVETGANISDHAFIQPQMLTLEIGVSECATGTGAYAGDPIQVYQTLCDMQESLEIFTVTTRLKTYENMMIMSIVAPEDPTTVHALRATIMLEELILVDTENVAISPRNSADEQKTGQTTGGTRQATETTPAENQSILSQLTGRAG